MRVARIRVNVFKNVVLNLVMWARDQFVRLAFSVARVAG